LRVAPSRTPVRLIVIGSSRGGGAVQLGDSLDASAFGGAGSVAAEVAKAFDTGRLRSGVGVLPEVGRLAASAAAFGGAGSVAAEVAKAFDTGRYAEPMPAVCGAWSAEELRATTRYCQLLFMALLVHLALAYPLQMGIVMATFSLWQLAEWLTDRTLRGL
jgi:hypothetical protein